LRRLRQAESGAYARRQGTRAHGIFDALQHLVGSYVVLPVVAHEVEVNAKTRAALLFDDVTGAALSVVLDQHMIADALALAAPRERRDQCQRAPHHGSARTRWAARAGR